MATYEITEVKSHPTKYAAMVSFNGKPAEYYEVELDPIEGDSAPAVETIAERVDRLLTREAVADEARTAAAAAAQAEVATIEVSGGQIVV